MNRNYVLKYLKVPNKDRIALALEMVCGQNLSPKEAAVLLDIPNASICGWMTCYWFYKKPDQPIILILKSKV
jgi:hypothetical protein